MCVLGGRRAESDWADAVEAAEKARAELRQRNSRGAPSIGQHLIGEGSRKSPSKGAAKGS